MRTDQKPMNETSGRVYKRLHYSVEVILVWVGWYVAYPLSVAVDHLTIHLWAIKILPVLAAIFRRRKRPVGASWRMGETYIKVAGQWRYLYRAVDKSDANTAAVVSIEADSGLTIVLRQSTYLNNIVEQDLRKKSGAEATFPLRKDRFRPIAATPMFGRRQTAKINRSFQAYYGSMCV